MLVRCPKCDTGFRLPAEKVPDKGAKVKCSACTHTFRVRVDDDGEPEYFYKRGEAPAEPRGSQTQIGSPMLGEAAAATSEREPADESGARTRLGAAARSKSAEEGYNPFPLAGKSAAEEAPPQLDGVDAKDGDRTKVFTGAAPSDESVETDSRGGKPAPPNDGDRTQLAPAGQAGRGAPPPVDVSEDISADGDSTQALGSGGGIHLFDDPDESGEAETSDDGSPLADFDPFGDAFDAPVDADVGLLMPSTPKTGEVPPPTPDSQPSLDEPSDVGLSEEDFLLGGTKSEFGPADELVDPSFGSDVAPFDPDSEVQESQPKPSVRRKKRSRSDSGALTADASEIELADVRPTPDNKAPQPSPRAVVDERPARQEKKSQKKRSPIGYDAAPHRIGATSPLRRAFDVVFITLVVISAFTLFVSARVGWFFDFKRVGHMLEVAFAGEEFTPREDWATVVEAEPVTPPPEEPLRLQNVRAFEQTVGDQPIVAVTGTIRNFSRQAFKSVTVRVEIVDSDGKIISDRTDKAGRTIDREKFARATSMKAIEEAMDEKLPDVGKEGKIHFAFVFDDVPADVLESGEYDYRVAITDQGS